MLGLPALVDGADVVGIAVLFQRGLHDLTHQLPVVQVLVLQLFGVNVGVLVHVCAVVDDLGEGAVGDGVAILETIMSVRIQCARQFKFFFGNGAIIIAIDDGGVAFAKVRGTVCLVAGAVGRDILIFDLVWVIAISFSSGTDRRGRAFSINVCVDNGIASAAVDVDVTGSVKVAIATPLVNPATNRRAVVTGSIILRRKRRIVGAKGIDCIYGAAGDVDGCCGIIVTASISNRRTIIGSNSCNIGIFFNIDREIRKAAIPTSTNGAAGFAGFCMYVGISGDCNSSRVVGAADLIAISNCSGKSRISINNGIVRNGDAVSTAETTADSGTILGSGSNMGIAFNADVFAGTAAAAANGSSAITSGNGSDITAGDGNIGRVG